MFERLLAPFSKLWRGQYSVARVFWGFFVLGIFIGLFAAAAVGVPLAMLGQPRAALIVIILFTLAYPLFAAVGVWRSASAHPSLYVGAAAKFGVLVITVTVVMRAFGINMDDIGELLVKSSRHLP